MRLLPKRRSRRRFKRRALRRLRPRSVVSRIFMRMSMWGVGAMLWVMRRTFRRMVRAAIIGSLRMA